MKKYLLIISCVWVSMSVAAIDMSSDVRAGDGQVTVTQRVSSVDAQGQAVDANETSANANSSSVGGTNNSRNDYSMVKPAVNTTLTPNTSIINGWGGRNHTPIKPGDEECDGTKLMSSSSHPTSIVPVSVFSLSDKGGRKAMPIGVGGRVPTRISPVNNQAVTNESDQSTLMTTSDNGDATKLMRSTYTSNLKDIIERGRTVTDGVGGRIVRPIDPIGGQPKPGKGKGTMTVAGTCRTFTSSGSEDSGDQGDILSKLRDRDIDDLLSNTDVLSNTRKFKFFECVILGGGGKKETPISPFSLPNPVIPTVVSGSKGSIENVTSMIDNLLTNGSSEGVSIEDVTSMIDTLLTE